MKKEIKKCYPSCESNFKGFCTRATPKERSHNSHNFEFKYCPFPASGLTTEIEVNNPETDNPIQMLRLRQIFRKSMKSIDGLAALAASSTAAYLTAKEIIQNLNENLPKYYQIANDIYEYIMHS